MAFRRGGYRRRSRGSFSRRNRGSNRYRRRGIPSRRRSRGVGVRGGIRM